MSALGGAAASGTSEGTMVELLTATDLDDWSGRRDAEAHLPTLVRRLIMATAAPSSLRIAAAEGIRSPGFDGVLDVPGGAPPYVPAGRSVWETSSTTSADIPTPLRSSDVDLRTLRALASDGFKAVPATELDTLVAWCDDWSIASGEARFSIIADALRTISDGWGEQGIPTRLVERIENSLRENLTLALDSGDPKDGAYFAGRLRDDVRALPWTVREWEAEGWARR